ncbi:TetR/AcrR family transcriptional regulator [uncultured Methanobacterium sp.]|uniref:TetR/AcrR family transcriptional regulator n=1 Tax=uncultured Methanobacterium sp. TaxID=176306 RepID=UPI002AA840AD|nr:TetR/AcrR family transcriptional regulator [uncultured Methanobacterium sp.]
MVPRKPRDERINEITQAAIDVFLEKGYENTTMDAIAKKAGISKGGLYHYFPSKEMVLIFANEKISQKVKEIMTNASKCNSVKGGILYYIENYICYWLKNPKETAFLFLSIAKMMENPDLLKYYQQYTSDYIAFFEGAFSLGIKMGEFKEHNARTSAITLMAALDGVLSYMIFDENLILEEVVQHFEEKFITPIEV